MSENITLLGQITQRNAFKNNRIYTGTLQITGSVSAGFNQRIFTIPLDRTPDLVSIMLNGPTDSVYGNDPRPADGWFKKGNIWAIGNGGAYSNYPVPFEAAPYIQGTNAIISLIYVQTFTDTLALSPTNFSYRILDYSVF